MSQHHKKQNDHNYDAVVGISLAILPVFSAGCTYQGKDGFELILEIMTSEKILQDSTEAYFFKIFFTGLLSVALGICTLLLIKAIRFKKPTLKTTRTSVQKYTSTQRSQKNGRSNKKHQPGHTSSTHHSKPTPPVSADARTRAAARRQVAKRFKRSQPTHSSAPLPQNTSNQDQTNLSDTELLASLKQRLQVDNQPVTWQQRGKMSRLCKGNEALVARLVKAVQQANPDRSEHWCWDKAIWDLERDRSR